MEPAQHVRQVARVAGEGHDARCHQQLEVGRCHLPHGTHLAAVEQSTVREVGSALRGQGGPQAKGAGAADGDSRESHLREGQH